MNNFEIDNLSLKLTYITNSGSEANAQGDLQGPLKDIARTLTPLSKDGTLKIVEGGRFFGNEVKPLFPLSPLEWAEIFYLASKNGVKTMPIPIFKQLQAFSDDQLNALNDLNSYQVEG